MSDALLFVFQNGNQDEILFNLIQKFNSTLVHFLTSFDINISVKLKSFSTYPTEPYFEWLFKR